MVAASDIPVMLVALLGIQLFHVCFLFVNCCLLAATVAWTFRQQLQQAVY
jgi:hypothetical protein